MAAGLALAIPASAEAKLRFRPCGEAVCGVLSVPLDHSGAVPGRLSLRVKRYPSFDPGPHGVVLVLAMPGSADAKVRFRPCGEASCGVLSVPLDHSGAVPGRLSLRVKRYPSFDPGPHGLVLVLAGAPGEAAFETEELLLETTGDDLVRFDQRGTGPSALRCRDLEAATPTDAGREAAACATLLGDRRAFFRTTDTVEDIEALRAELGAERLTIVGPA